MQIRKLTAFEVPIALRKPIRHASHERRANDTLIVRAELTDGSVGWGEGLPRPYVTGETIATVWEQLHAADFSPLADMDFADAHSLALAVDRLQLPGDVDGCDVPRRECFGNSVRCALELALLDAAGRSSGRSVGDLLLDFPESAANRSPVDRVRYSGVITSGSTAKQYVSALKMKLFGFSQVKVKVGTQGINDTDCLRHVRRVLGRGVELRLDANEAWHPHDVIRCMQPLLPFSPVSLEQPVPHAEVALLKDVRRDLPTPIMLDESLCCEEDAQRAIAGDYCDLFNIRLSKCGGLLRSVRLAAMAIDAGLGFQLGCQVGETGILSAAGRHFACNIGGARFLEGSYDRFLVRERVTAEDLTFGYRGFAPRLNRPGLGITVGTDDISRLSARTLPLINQ